MADELFDLSGKVAVVTGGSRGLGRSMCLAFAGRGADVVIASRKIEACEALAAEIEKTTGRAALATACHVGRWGDCDRLVESAYDRFGHVDVLVNNAGMSPPYPSLPEVSEELFDKVLAVNLKGAFRLSTLFGTRMAEAGGGSIINVTSIAAVYPGADELPYAAAKAGLNVLTAGFARAFAPSVRVNCIMPGMFRTDIANAWSSDMVAAAMRTLPFGRMGEASEIIGAALYFASEASSYTTGAILKIDGGTAFPAA
ncbi:glucose 1-dehydrogenase [Frankia sp. CNm7]|uniref:Glucose 1-dehydrogenase n=1 Tax=Frankia nepalensis TaxID=1836974 RepID=A0A937UQB2_9ACTN|nr:glucose 1-dehydrogenase [Frankia nepalensis]MBL7500217.1 glucose 1-dehydrogenase [Frankia nepalensis]MBL7514608.1 glucose 1-dehydrogenase [Frankia nepalensis]MBL7524306.1 glucose 1-dehydrogenase [Frankia nepalensis]MBL7631679.1 glucose 1-dehydrogenase [Frankia nepalensis]